MSAGAGFDEALHPRDAQGKFASALETWAARKGELRGQLTKREAYVQGAAIALTERRRERDRAQATLVAHKADRPVPPLPEPRVTFGMNNGQYGVSDDSRVERENKEAARERRGEAEKGRVPVEVPSEQKTLPGVSTERPAPVVRERVPVDPALGTWSGRASARVPDELTRASIGQAQRRENERRVAAGQPQLVPGSREHKEFVERYREQHRAALAALGRGAAVPGARTLGPNEVHITPRTAVERTAIRVQNTRDFGFETAQVMDRLFGDRVPTKSDFERGYGLNDGTKAKVDIKVAYDSGGIRVFPQLYDREHSNVPMFDAARRIYSKDPDGTLKVYHAIWEIKPEYRSSGLGAQILANQVRLAHEMGVRRIATGPAGANGWSYDKWKENTAENKKNQEEFKEGKKNFGEFRERAHELDTGMFGPHAWAAMGFTHSGSYTGRFADYLRDQHRESIAKMALGEKRYAELTKPAAPGVSSQVHSRVERAREIVAGLKTDASVTKASLDKAVEKLRAHSLALYRQEPNSAARQAVSSAYRYMVDAQGSHDDGRPGSVRANIDAAVLRLSDVSPEKSSSRPSDSRMTDTERSKVDAKANEIAQKVAPTGQGRDIVHFKLPDGREAGSHFMASIADNPFGTWKVEMKQNDSGWQLMKKKLRLTDLDP